MTTLLKVQSNSATIYERYNIFNMNEIWQWQLHRVNLRVIILWSHSWWVWYVPNVNRIEANYIKCQLYHLIQMQIRKWLWLVTDPVNRHSILWVAITFASSVTTFAVCGALVKIRWFARILTMGANTEPHVFQEIQGPCMLRRAPSILREAKKEIQLQH